MKLIPRVVGVAIALVGAAACGSRPEDPAPDAGLLGDLAPELQAAVESSLDLIDANAALLGLRGRGQVKLAHAFVDELDLTHARFQQTLDGVPVFGGEGIVHLRRDRSISSVTDAFVPWIAVDTTPKLTPGEAISHALPKGVGMVALATPPPTDLWVLRHEGRDRLVWRVQRREGEGTNDISMPVVFVDAHDGSIVWQYDNLQTGSGPSLYSGTLTFDTTPNAGLYYMEDIPRKLGTFDMKNGSSTLFRFDDADDVFDAAAQRAGIDAHYGALQTYEYFKNVHNRNGINGNGGPGSQLAIDGVTQLVTSRVHYSSGYNNAFWDGTRMTYGDGNGVQFSPLVTLDVAGHEMMHGITQFTAGLVYSGESGALNESYSDVFGAMVERYARGESPAIWMIGDECYTPATPGDALRHMDAPHLASNKGYTADDDPDHYSERYTGSGDNGGVHINSGISNKTFYLLAQGGSHHLGGSMTGIGADKAAAIWYKALTTYMTTSTNFARAGRATYDAAVAIHGAESPEAAAVVTAWGMTGIVVDIVPPVTSITAPADGATIEAPTTITASATDNVAIASVQFLINGVVVGTDTTVPYSYSWNTAASGNGTYTIASKAFDAAGGSATSAPITVTVAHETVPPAVTITAPADGATVANTVTVTATATDNTAVARVELLVNGALQATDTTAPYSFSWNTTALPNGPQAILARAFDTVGNSTISTAVNVTTDNDKTPPVVAITAPASGAVLENTVTIAADAIDNVGVTRVDFYAGSTLLGSDTTAPYSFTWNTHPFPDGTYALQARAWDALNNIGTSANVNVTVDNDSIPPVVSITSPADGSTVSGTVTVTADATDNVAVTRVELRVNGVLVGTDTAAPWSFAWDSLVTGNGTHTLVARAYDALNNSANSLAVTVTASNPGIAAYDPVLRAPRCVGESNICDTVGLVNGRDGKGPEPNASNTIGGTCIDGTSGSYHGDESLDRLRISTPDGLPIASGKPITIEATAWVWSASSDRLDLYHTASPSSPFWTLIGTFTPSGSGQRTMSTTFTLPPGSQHAIRGQFRYSGTASPCTTGSYNDRDDLVFTAIDVPDTTPPVTSITAPAAGATLTGVATVTATATDNVGVTAVRLLVDGALVATDTTAPYSFAWNTGSVPDGAHTLMVRALDAAGNTADSAPVGISVLNPDVTPPTASITTPLNGNIVDGTFTVFVTATDAVGVTSVELLVDGTLIATDTTAPYGMSWNTTTVPDGPHTLQARAHDAAGNVGISAPISITVDNIDSTPPFVVLVSPAPGASVSGVTTVTVSATDNMGVAIVELYVDGILVQSDTVANYYFAWDTTTVGNGPHTLQARARDAASNESTSLLIGVTVNNPDTTPPVASIFTPLPGSTVSEVTAVNVTATDNIGVTAVELYVDGILVDTDTAAPYSFAWNTAAVPNGGHTLQARARDAANNVGVSAPIGIVVGNADTTPPVASITSPLPGGTVSGVRMVSVTSSDFNGVTAVELYVDATLLVTVPVGTFSYAWNTAAVPNGPHTLQARARDAAGNVGLSAAIGVIVANVDVTPPVAMITSPLPGSTVSDATTVNVPASDFNGVTSVELYVDGNLIATDATAPFSLSWDTTSVPNGAHTLQARARDAAGNVGVSAPIGVTVANLDTTPPTTSITAPAPGEVIAGTVTVTSSSADFNGVTAVELLLDGTVIATATSAPWSFTWDTTTVANRARILSTRALDAAGNAGVSAPVAITVDNGIGTAAYDPVLRAPRCAVGYDGCDTSVLVDGRGPIGPEPNAPNTINDSCADGTSGGYHSSTSIDRLRVFTADGTPLAAGKTVTLEATVWNYYNHPSYDVVDFYYTSSPSSPSWVYIGSVTPGSPGGIRVVTRTFTLPSGAEVAVRANMRRKQGANKESICTPGELNDRDDLVFAVGGP